MGVGTLRRRTGVALVVVAIAAVVPSVCSAQNDEVRAAARAAATQGLAEEQAGHWREAIELFERAESMVHAPPHLLHIARASAKLGRLVSAQEAYLKITREELAEGAPRAFVEAQSSAREELAALVPRIPTLKVVVDGGTGTVTMDGKPVPPALVGIAFPVDPGSHELRATGSGSASAPVVVEVAEGRQETVKLVLERVAADAASDAPAAASPAKGEQAPRSKVPAYVAWGVGAAGLAAGTVMMLVNRGKRDDADALCPNGACPQSRRAEVEALDADADSAATMSLVGYGVGVVGLGVGTFLYFMSKEKAPSDRRAGVGSWLTVGATGVTGRF